MPSLREPLKSPVLLLALLGLAAVAVALDATREPERQLSARAYDLAVRGYQIHARPVLSGRVACRYRPSCSQYSREAVRGHGIVKGVLLTASRIWRCRRDVANGTYDPVPGHGSADAAMAGR